VCREAKIFRIAPGIHQSPVLQKLSLRLQGLCEKDSEQSGMHFPSFYQQAASLPESAALRTGQIHKCS